MNRRDTHSGLLSHTASVIAPWLIGDGPLPATESPLLYGAHQAMATRFELFMPVGTPDGVVHIHQVMDLIDELETQMTVYRSDSELAHINRLASEEPVVVEDGLFQLLAKSAQLTSQTWGAFDITAGPLIRAWGFYHRQGRVPSPTERQQALQCVGMRHVELNAERRTVGFRRSGIELNLGSIGKGHALDRAAGYLAEQGVTSALIHGGGSSVRGVGHPPEAPRGWPVGVRHPWEEQQRLGTVYLRDRAMGTSAATHQHFTYNGRRVGHLLDPRTGRPAEGIASATAIAPSAAEADALATAFFVLGVEKTRLFCAGRPDVGAVLLPDGETEPVIVNLDSESFALSLPRGHHRGGIES